MKCALERGCPTAYREYCCAVYADPASGIVQSPIRFRVPNMKPEMIQSVLWWVFLIYYTAYKYLVALQVWNLEYAIQVGLLVIMTAIIPYYFTKFTLLRLSKPALFFAATLLPALLALIGYAVFYYTRVLPNFPDVTLNQVLPRSIFPGVCMALMFIIPIIVSRTQSPATKRM